MTVAAAQPPEDRAASSQAAAEAARYALLRRLAPSMRHHLVVNLQPIGMIYEVMERRLRSPEPDLASVHDSAHKINGFARAALGSCLDVVSWLAPEDGAVTHVADGVRECTSLLTTGLSFRGFVLRNDVTPFEGEVPRAAIRNLLTAALIHVTDEHAGPAELVLTARAASEGAQLVLALHATPGEKGFAGESTYRPIAWSDVEALAAAERVQLERDGAERVLLTIPWARA
ncbi:MAG TPA: hypothetical protein VHA82_01045 [Ramlibacter sp.]|uniref:hypothetical protein n=1 Tax=Ramlibacter sp. TaxID=1917967 RepID=UPI002CCA2E0D|nr:hypothetical protein [Ramlibacter sp.]HVZ42367.1 hypothetical protein [Ramlibacter sp.]